MSEQPQLDALVALIEAQRGRRDRAAIREQLVHDGADPAVVDQALARVYDTPGHGGAAVYDIPPAQPQQQLVVPTASEVERVRQYLEQHRETYDREALRRQLLADGASREAVDLAFAQVFGLHVTASPTAIQPSTGGRVFLIFLAATVLNLVASGGLAYAATIAESLWVVLLPGVLLIAAEIGAMVYYRPRNRPLSRGIMWALIAALPIIAFGLLLGWCVAVIQNI